MTDFSANAASLGYFYQACFALLKLLQADPDAEMSLERFDDVAFEEAGTPTQLLQTKHHITHTASLSDSRTDLWKTLRVWSESVLTGLCRPEETIFTLITTGRASQDSAASLLRPENRDVERALEILSNIVAVSESQTNKSAYEAFKRLSNEQRRALVSRVTIFDSSPNITDVRGQIIKELRLTVRPKFLTLVCERVEGWWFDRVIKHLTEDSRSPILAKELHDQVHDIQEQYFEESLPIEFLEMIGPDEDDLDQADRVFVQQLRLVMVQEPRIRFAINNYYRAFEQRAKWIREDLLHVGELDRYETRLIEEWRIRYEIMRENFGEELAEVHMQDDGRALYNWVETQAEIRIRPKVTEPYVMRGSYHILANQLRVGWHAEFLTRLSRIIGTAA
jgi:hypothetical protein